MRVDKRRFLIGTACAVVGQVASFNAAEAHFNAATGAKTRNVLSGEPFPVRLVRRSELDPKYWKQLVFIESNEPAGTIVVDTQQKFLFLILGGGRALRYGIGVGRQGFSWSGTATIRWKQKWPKWTPPKDMIERDPRAAKFADGMPGGLDNPLGARALYLFQGRRDTLYRLHGTSEVESIGHAVSSGCVRLLNQDVIDLYERVPTGTRVVVLPPGQVVMSRPTPQAVVDQWRDRLGLDGDDYARQANYEAPPPDLSSFFERLFR